MTQEERDQLICKMLDTPNTLSGKEIDAALQDEELREMYNTAAMLKAAATQGKEYDIDKEWQAFAHKQGLTTAGKPSRKVIRLGMRVPKWAAAVIIMLSLGAVAATITFTYKALDEKAASAQAGIEATGTQAGHRQDADAEKEEVRLAEELMFENATLAEIAKQVSEAFGCKVSIAGEELESLRLYLTLPKGSTAASFAQVIDAYSMLAATMQDNTVIIRRQEEKQ